LLGAQLVQVLGHPEKEDAPQPVTPGAPSASGPSGR